MKAILLKLLLLVFTTITAQQNIFYDIPIGNRYGQKAFEHFHSETSKILSYKIERSKYLKKRLLQESFNTKSDTVSFIATYWCQENGVVLPYMFGSSLGRETAAHVELKKILSRFKISPEDMKKLTRFRNGDQVVLRFNYRKITNPINQRVHFEHFWYSNKKTPSSKYTDQRNPIHKGCDVSKKSDLSSVKTQVKIKNCMSRKIDKLIQNNFRVNQLKEHPFIKGRQVSIFNSFIINNQGQITNINAVSLRPELEQEAIRILSKIPPLKPATKNGEPASIIYNKPITFIAN